MIDSDCAVGDPHKMCLEFLRECEHPLQTKVMEWACRFSEQKEWSTCEIGLSEQEYNILMSQMAEVEACWFRRPSDWLGLALTITLAECARRHSGEGNLWVPLSDELAELPWHSIIFNRVGQPTQKCRKILESAARAYKLRHVYDQEGTMAWFVSLRLQFGFSKKGFEARLHEWLGGSTPPLPQELLLSTKMSGSFRKLWRHLWLYRNDKCNRHQLHDCLMESPWVLHEWHEALFLKALERREYDYIYRSRQEKESDLEKTTDEYLEGQDSFLSGAHLIWERHSKPLFQVSIDDDVESIYRLGEPEYAIVIEGQQLGRILKQSDNSYHAESSTITLSRPLPQMYAELRGETGECLGQWIELWDEFADFTVFDLDAGGVALEDKGDGLILKADSEYAALLAAGLQLDVTVLGSCSLCERRLVRFKARSDEPVLIKFDDGAVLTALSVIERPAIDLEGLKARLVEGANASFGGLKLPARYSVEVTVPSHAELRRVRRNGRVMQGEFSGGVWASSPLDDISEAEHAKGIRLQITVTIGVDTLTTSRTLYPKVSDVLLWEEKSDKSVLRSAVQDSVMHTRRGRNTRFLFRINGDVRLHYVFEGHFCHGRLNPKFAPLRNLHGYGARLATGFGRLNTSNIKNIASTVIDTGILEKVSDGEIKLLNPLRFSGIHKVVVVNSDWSLSSFPARNGASSMSLRASLPEATWIAVGLFFKGKRLGSLWNQDREVFSCALETADPRRVSQITTVFKLPFLCSVFKDAMRSYVLRHLADFLETWTEQSRVEVRFDGVDFEWPDILNDEAFKYSVSAFMGTARLSELDDMAFNNILRSFGGEVNSVSLRDAALLLDDILDYSPRLAARLANSFSSVDKDKLCEQILGMKKGEARRISSEALGVDAGFIGRQLTADGASDQKWNNHVLRIMGNRTFRKLLTCFLISNPKV